MATQRTIDRERISKELTAAKINISVSLSLDMQPEMWGALEFGVVLAHLTCHQNIKSLSLSYDTQTFDQ